MKKLASLVFAAAILLVVPSIASAATLCVNAPAADCTTEYASGQLQMALTDAENNNQDNTLRIGAGTYTGTFTYGGNGHAMLIQGAGQGATVISLPNLASGEKGLAVAGPDTAIEDLDVKLKPANSNSDIGIDANLTDIRRVHIIGNGSDNSTGVRLIGGSLTDATVDQALSSPSGTLAVFAGGNVSIASSTLSGASGVNFSAPGATLNASRLLIHAKNRGIETDGGTVNVDDTLIDLGNFDGTGLLAENSNASTNAKTINANHVTIAGSGTSFNSKGVRVRAAMQTAKQTATVTLNNSIITGTATSIQRNADNDGLQGGPSVANVITSYSNYDPATIDEANGPNGSGSITATHQTNLAPGFVDAAGGDYRLTAASALIDAGDPAAGGPATDLDGGARVVDGNGDFVDQRDLGAYERPDTTAPPVQITSGPPAVTTDPVVTFQFTSPDPAATFQCRFDSDAFTACTATGSHTATVSAGSHTFDVRAADAHGNTSTASQAFTIEGPPADTPPDDTPPDDTPPSDQPPADTKAPQTTISGPARIKTTKKHVRVSFSADDPTARFECRLDKGAFGACASPYRTPKLKPGKHTLTVRATDPAGNVEATPPSVKIKVKRKPKGR